jgi:iron complex transport system ATP-binding protein
MTSAATGPDAPTTVLATHHREEVPSTVTHAALLTAGGVVDRGPVEAVLSESALSRCYGLDIVVERRDGRWWARAR